MNNLYELWLEEEPEYATRFKEELEAFSNFHTGSEAAADVKGKTFGAGYEVLILAFFIGLYCDKPMKLTGEKSKLRMPMATWGNFSSPRMHGSYYYRRNFNTLVKYMFVAMVTKCSDTVDYISLDKGEIDEKRVVNILVRRMEEYINFGLQYLRERRTEDKNSLYRSGAFYNLIAELTKPQ